MFRNNNRRINGHKAACQNLECLEDRRLMSVAFTVFNVINAANDFTPATVFQGSALRVNFATRLVSSSKYTYPVMSVGLMAQQGASRILLGQWSSGTLSNGIISLNRDAFRGMTGAWTLKATAIDLAGGRYDSSLLSINILPVTHNAGTFQADNLNIAPSGATVVDGLGGTDTLILNTPRSAVAMNGYALSSPNINSTTNQAVYEGKSYDFLRLADGREVYMDGIERIQCADGTISLEANTNDPSFTTQWNLFTTDTVGAWRFNSGNSTVMLATLDTGLPTNAQGAFIENDMTSSRLITDSTDANTSGHGHMALSVMVASRNNSSGIAGINAGSPVMVNNVYGSSYDVYSAIANSVAYARSQNCKIIFQSGIQGEGWLTHPGGTHTQADLEQLITNCQDIALFVVAAGNGGPGGNLIDANYATSVSGVAKLQTNHSNVIAAGALEHTATTVAGLANASNVNLASYSNHGSNLTMVAPTDSPAVNSNNGITIFDGTSCANPNLAAMASLVWSANASLTPADVRGILTSTAMDIGAAGRDNTFGAGLVNTELAVRTADARVRDARLVAANSAGLLGDMLRVAIPLHQLPSPLPPTPPVTILHNPMPIRSLMPNLGTRTVISQAPAIDHDVLLDTAHQTVFA